MCRNLEVARRDSSPQGRLPGGIVQQGMPKPARHLLYHASHCLRGALHLAQEDLGSWGGPKGRISEVCGHMVFAMLAGLALVGQQIGTESAAFGPARLESDGGSGDMGYAGSNGLEPQKVASNNQPCGFICYGFGESRCLACSMLGDR